jgi:hypothetical protein
MRTRFAALTAIVIAAAVLAGCAPDDPMSRANIVARTVSQELTVAQLSLWLGNAKMSIDVTDQTGLFLTSVWSSYQRLAYAAAHNDSLTSHMEAAITPTLNSARLAMLLQQMRRGVTLDSASAAGYAAAMYGLYDVRHIAIRIPQGASPRQIDSLRAVADTVRRAVTPANFKAMARKYSTDTASAERGGDLGVFRKEQINAPVFAAIKSLPLDTITPPVQTAQSFEIVQRLSWQDARPLYVPIFNELAKQHADSIATEHLSAGTRLAIQPDGFGAARLAAQEPILHYGDSTTLATFDRGGRFTVGDMLAWLNTLPPAQRVQLQSGIPMVADSVLTSIVRSLAMRNVLLRAADSAKIEVPDSAKVMLRRNFYQSLATVWKDLGISPESLADSASTPADRERIASARVDKLIDRAMAHEVEFPVVTVIVENALDAKYKTELSHDALARAVRGAVELRNRNGAAPVNAPVGRGVKPGAAPLSPKPTP